MIISRSPVRLSFFGSSSDYPIFFRQHGGISISCTINKFSWWALKPLLPFFAHKSKITYSEVEEVYSHDEIKHRVVKACLQRLKVDEGVDIAHMSDLFSKCGLGSSSTFAVGLVTALRSYLGIRYNTREIAETVIDIEQNILKDHVGYQDTLAAAHGGFNLYRYKTDGTWTADQLCFGDFTDYLDECCLLFFTGQHRNSNDLTSKYVPSLLEKEREQIGMMEIAELGLEALRVNDLMEVGRLLNLAWHAKKSISPLISTPQIDELFRTCIYNEARGFKLLGGGGGGSFLVIAEPEKHERIREALKGLMEIPFNFEYEGTRIVYKDNSYARK